MPPPIPAVATEHPVVERLRRDESLARAVRRGALAAATSRFGMQAVGFASTVALARLLTPNDYGLYALTASVCGLAALFIDAGFSAAVIQVPTLSERLAATAFWANLVMAVLLAGLIDSVSPLLAQFFHEPRLVPLTLVASITMLLSCNGINVAFLRRGLRFDIEGRMNLVGQIMATAVTIGAAVSGAGPYSLVLGPVADRVLMLAWSFAVVRWIPRLGPDRGSFHVLWRYSRGYSGAALVGYGASNADRFILGKVASLAGVGLYNRASNLAGLASQQLVGIVTYVAFPSLSRMSHDEKRLARTWLMMFECTAILTTCVASGLATVGGTFIRVVYGSRWVGIAPLLSVLAAASVCTALAGVTNPLLEAKGRTDTVFRRGLATSVILVATMLVGARLGGPLGLALGLLAAGPVVLGIGLRPVVQSTALRWSHVLGSLLRPLLIGVLLFLVLGFTHRILEGLLCEAGQLAVLLVLGAGVSGVSVLLLERHVLRAVFGVTSVGQLPRVLVRRRAGAAAEVRADEY